MVVIIYCFFQIDTTSSSTNTSSPPTTPTTTNTDLPPLSYTLRTTKCPRLPCKKNWKYLNNSQWVLGTSLDASCLGNEV